MISQRTFTIGACVLLSGAAAIVYGRALAAPFVFDDAVSVGSNSSIEHLWPLIGTAEFPGPLNPAKELPISGRPLVNLSLAVNYLFGQHKSIGYHIFNLFVHVLSTWLVLAIVWRTLRLDYFAGRFDRASGPLAVAAALLWAVHPLQTETVEYVTQRTELLVGFFYLATLYASLRYWTATSGLGRNTWVALAALACAAGMASKEVMVTAPVVVLLFERTFLSATFRRALRRSWPLYIGLALGWLLLAWLNYDEPRAASAGFNLGIPASAWWLTQSKVLWMYLELTVWPWPLAIYYQFPFLNTVGAAWPWVLATALLVIATLILVWRRSAIGFVAAWILLILSPTLIVPIGTEMAAERRMYLPLAALAALVVVGGYALAQHAARLFARADAKPGQPPKPALLGITCAALLVAMIFAAVSTHRLAMYREERTLWQDVLQSQPENFVAHYNLGNQLVLAGKQQDALAQYQVALNLNPTYPNTYYNMGNTLLDLGRTQEGIACLQHALQLKPEYADVHNSLGTALADMGKLPEAIAEYQETLRLKPDTADAHNNLGNALMKLNRPQDSIEHYNLALRYKPDYPDAHANLAAALLNLGRYDEAIDHCQQAIEQNPDYADGHCNLGVALAKVGKLPEAIVQYREALRLKPKYFNAEYNLGNTLYEAGQVQEAAEHFQQAILLNPDDAQAHYNLGNALQQIGQLPEAIEQYQSATQLKPDYAEAHNNLGSSLLRAGRPEEAIEQYQQTVHLKPDHPKAYFNMAGAYAQLHRSAEAVAAAQKAIELARSTEQTELANRIEAWINSYRAELTKSPNTAPPSTGGRAAP